MKIHSRVLLLLIWKSTANYYYRYRYSYIYTGTLMYYYIMYAAYVYTHEWWHIYVFLLCLNFDIRFISFGILCISQHINDLIKLYPHKLKFSWCGVTLLKHMVQARQKFIIHILIGVCNYTTHINKICNNTYPFSLYINVVGWYLFIYIIYRKSI